NDKFSGLFVFFGYGCLDLQTDGINHDPLPNGDIRDGKCHHVAVTRSSSTLLSWYVDGVLKSTSADANYDVTTSGPFIIGNDFAESLNDPFKGTIQEIRFWNVARTQSQLQANMNDT